MFHSVMQFQFSFWLGIVFSIYIYIYVSINIYIYIYMFLYIYVILYVEVSRFLKGQSLKELWPSLLVTLMLTFPNLVESIASINN